MVASESLVDGRLLPTFGSGFVVTILRQHPPPLLTHAVVLCFSPVNLGLVFSLYHKLQEIEHLALL